MTLARVRISLAGSQRCYSQVSDDRFSVACSSIDSRMQVQPARITPILMSEVWFVVISVLVSAIDSDTEDLFKFVSTRFNSGCPPKSCCPHRLPFGHVILPSHSVLDHAVVIVLLGLKLLLASYVGDSAPSISMPLRHSCWPSCLAHLSFLSKEPSDSAKLGDTLARGSGQKPWRAGAWSNHHSIPSLYCLDKLSPIHSPHRTMIHAAINFGIVRRSK
ncbi:hypothetical protein BV22DRAFT_641548 [Leucogyrophana mollusca]|uniref:Uncharacterized protein n=1 Tax=Leucogyrophana mollusca TaxID=85980 RepID=A0ACB8BCX6_9AGAM|nr:hypothetical protein BV22DRAFT_641548 [Leucogyrophana mollusca]